MRFGRVIGVPIVVSYSWLALFVLATYFMAFVQLPTVFPTEPLWVRLIGGLVFTVLFFGSVVFHELAHTLTALSQHLRVRGITIMIFGGFTAVEGETTFPRAEALIAAAGPVASFLLGITFATVALTVGIQQSVLGFISWGLGAINLALAFLNMLPGLPLDGGRVFLAVAWRVTGSRYKGALAAANAGRFLGLAEVLVGLVLLVFYDDMVLGVSLVLVGWFLRSAAGSARQQFMEQEALRGLTARDVLVTRWPRVTIGTAVSTMAEDMDFMQGRRSYLVYQDGTWAGMLPVRAVKSLNPEERRGLRVGDVMVPQESIIRIQPGDELLAVLRTMEQERVGYAPVLDETGQVIGVLSRDHIQQTVFERVAASKQKPQRGGASR